MHDKGNPPLSPNGKAAQGVASMSRRLGISLACCVVALTALGISLHWLPVGARQVWRQSESLFEKYQAASRLSIKRVIATDTNVSLVVGNSS